MIRLDDVTYIKEREEMEGQDEKEKKDLEDGRRSSFGNGSRLGVSIGVGWLLRLQGFLELLVS
ncbi:hypothetical protein Tco_1352487, partial [Tanacetum coccineum]